MNKFKCNHCDTILDKDEIEVNVVSDPFCTGDSPSEEEWFCPECGGDSIDDVYMCVECGEHEAAEGYDECTNCIVED